jgi:hypothetical protein
MNAYKKTSIISGPLEIPRGCTCALFLQDIRWRVRARESFAFETTPAGPHYARLMPILWVPELHRAGGNCSEKIEFNASLHIPR